MAISCFRLEPSLRGAGGFDLIAESDQPIFYDLNTKQGRNELGILGQHAAWLESSPKGGRVVAFRVQKGDDASCLNLYQPRQPRVLGVPRQLVHWYSGQPQLDFLWAETLAETDEERRNPWLLLQRRFDDGAIPVVLDKNTAMYSMKLYSLRGSGTTFQISDDRGQSVRYRIVGLLSNSVFQGSLLVSEGYFEDLFPQVDGYQLFLINSQPAGEEVGSHVTTSDRPGLSRRIRDRQQAERSSDKLMGMLEDRLGDYGFDVRHTRDVLESLLAVQNTYLSTFQSLGALGLLLGTLGLATVQVRGVIERRGELALMRATGFRPARLASMVLMENSFLLLAGLAVGVVAAMVAVFPHWLAGGANLPLALLAKLLGTVVGVGLVSGGIAVRAALRAGMVSALRAG